jgi:hypothetical protein
MAEQPTAIPEVQRVVDERGNRTLKLSIGKKRLHGDPSLGRLVYANFLLNGLQYCRPHLMIYCHLCEENNQPLRDEVDAEREALGIRLGGDPRINATAEEWKNYIQEKQLETTLKGDLIRQMYGKGDAQTYEKQWETFMGESKAEEAEINDRFLAKVKATFDEGASQCCYYACAKPDAEKLFRCAGCGVAKYCSKDHQLKDWSWEHKGECTSNIPQFVKDEMEQDRQRNLRGDCEKIER